MPCFHSLTCAPSSTCISCSTSATRFIVRADEARGFIPRRFMAFELFPFFRRVWQGLSGDGLLL
jgi:hypothetical protein